MDRIEQIEKVLARHRRKSRRKIHLAKRGQARCDQLEVVTGIQNIGRAGEIDEDNACVEGGSGFTGAQTAAVMLENQELVIVKRHDIAGESVLVPGLIALQRQWVNKF